MTNMLDIPTFEPEVLYDDELEEAIFICPYSNTNVFKWEEDGYPRIEELIIYTNNLADTNEDAHVNKRLLPLKREFLQNERMWNQYKLEDYILTELDSNTPYYRLILQHPEGERSDFLSVIYQGVYSDNGSAD
jgi:hypothetical protein